MNRLLAVSLIALAAGCSGRQPSARPAPARVATLATAPDQHFTNGGVTIRYRDFGRGTPVVLLHGFGSEMMAWGAFADSVATSHRVIAIDIRGHGQSDKPSGVENYGRLMGDDAMRLLDHLRLRQAHFAGHSMGAVISANLAVRYPERVSSVTLIAGPLYPDSMAFVRETGRFLTDMREGRGLVAFLQWIAPGMPLDVATRVNANFMQTNDINTLIAVFESIYSLALHDGPQRRVPAFFVVGSGDPLVPLSGQLSSRWSGSTVTVVPGANHVNVLMSPETLAGLRRLTAASRN